MNILLYLFNQSAKFMLTNNKKLLILIPFMLGIIFSLGYIWHIHDYHFVFPKSPLLYVLSSMGFLTSILVVLKYIHAAKIFKRITKSILIVCGLIFIGYLLSEFKIIDHKILRFQLIKLLTFILCLVNIIVILFENRVFHNSSKYVMNHKLEVLMYIICLLPFIIYASLIYPGGMHKADTEFQFLQAAGVHRLENWHSPIIQFFMRLSLAFQLPGLSLLYIIKIVGMIYSALLMSRVVSNKWLKYLVFIAAYGIPVLMYHFYLRPKDAEATLFITFAIAMLLYITFKKFNYNFYLGIFCLLVASLSRHNQITQTMILLIPFSLVYIYYKQQTRKVIVYFMILFALCYTCTNKALFENHRIVYIQHPAVWGQSADINIITIENDLPCTKCTDVKQEFKKNGFTNIIGYSHLWKKVVTPQKNNTAKWIKYVLNYPGSWLLFHYDVAFKRFLGKGNVLGKLSSQNYIQSSRFYKSLLTIKQDTNYSIGTIKFSSRYIDHFMNKYGITIYYKYKLILMLIIIFCSFMLNHCTFCPKIMGDQNKSIVLSYYLSVSCLTLFIPIVLLTPQGAESRYLAATDYPLIVSMVLLLVYCCKKISFLNAHMKI